MPDLERIQVLTPGTLSQQWTQDGVVADPGTVTLGITRADGTVLVAAGASTTGTGTSPRTYNLTTTHTALLDKLAVTWTSMLKGTLTSYVEVVGGFLFSIADALAVSSLASFPIADIADARTGAEQDIERLCGCAFVQRYAKQTISGDGSRSLQLKHPLVKTVRTATIAGTALTSTELADLTFTVSGEVWSNLVWWTCGRNNVTVGYEHGFQDTPVAIHNAALTLAKMRLLAVNSPIDDRTTTFASAEGGTYALAVAGRGGSYFGLPDVDAAIDRYSMATFVA